MDVVAALISVLAVCVTQGARWAELLKLGQRRAHMSLGLLAMIEEPLVGGRPPRLRVLEEIPLGSQRWRATRPTSTQS